MKSAVLALPLALLAAPVQAADPASSWLSYAQYAAADGARITALNTTWTVPANPAVDYGSNAPGWWFGM